MEDIFIWHSRWLGKPQIKKPCVDKSFKQAAFIKFQNDIGNDMCSAPLRFSWFKWDFVQYGLKKKNKKDSFDDMFFFIQTFSLKLKQHTLKQILNTKFYGVYLSFVETSD